MSLLEPVRLPYCDVLMTGRWDAPAGRWFAALRVRHGFRWLLGHLVVEEYGTISSPLFLAPRPLLGKIYDAGISLAHRRDSEMALDLGWPPLCVGVDATAPPLPSQWQRQMQDAIVAGAAGPGPALPLRAGAIDGHDVAIARFDGADRAGGVSIVATSAPLLPAQLGRLCDLDDRGLTIAFATGNRVTRQAGRPQDITVLSEARYARLAAGVTELLA